MTSKKFIFESVLDDMETSSSGKIPVESGNYIPRPGEWNFCLMCPDWTSTKHRAVERILEAFAEDWKITYVRECPAEIDDVMDGGKIGRIRDYDCSIIEFSCDGLMNKVKCLWFLLAQNEWMPAFICHDGKWCYIQDNQKLCSGIRFLMLAGRIKLDRWGMLGNDMYGMIWPYETFDLDHCNALNQCMDALKWKFERRISMRRERGDFNIFGNNR